MKIWMITGASRGLGRAFAQEAVNKGDAVIAAVRKVNPEDELLRHERVLPVIMDVTRNDEIHEAVMQGVQKFGRIDLLVNNAGFGMNGAFEEITNEELRLVFEADYFGVVNVTKAVLPFMRRQGQGRIINVASQAGLMGFPGGTAYASAKYAVVGLSECLNIELAPFKIQVAAVAPGAFRTDFRDPSSIRFPQKLMPEYDGNAAHDVVRWLAENNHRQQGDPAKAAAFLYEAVTGENIPSLLVIGKDCADASLRHYSRLLEGIRSQYDGACRTSFEE